MSTLVFTICARNYIGLSKVLGQSISKHGQDIDFRIYVAEDMGDNDDPDIISAPRAVNFIIGNDEFANMAFSYNVTEFCTSLKAACFMHGFADGYDNCIYMDPDIFLVSDVSHITKELESSAILITPHLCLPAVGEGPRADRGILATGVYNLGFLALRHCKEAWAFLEWWHERLRNQAFNDHYDALYTDQRWIDFVPALFPASTVRIWRHLGCNVAPWNYHERRIEPTNSGFSVCPRHGMNGETGVPLVFLHFSGFDFRGILDGQFDQLNLADAETYTDVMPLYEEYGEAVRSMSTEMRRYLSMPYSHDFYADGTPILPSHRRLFRIWRERHGDAAAPFSTGSGSFHAALKQQNLLGKSGADLAADKATARTIRQPVRLMRRARSVFRIIFFLIGRRRFFLLMRSLNKFTRIEQHYDTFNLDDSRINPVKSAMSENAR